MKRPLVEALHRRPLSRPPVWIMRQAGRYLPEYRELRERHSFQDAVSTPELATEITLQPIRRFGMDGAVIFADIMTPLEAMGVDVTFDPGPRLRPHTLEEVIALGDLNLDRVGFVSETIHLVRDALPEETAIIGFAGAPLTVLAYLVEGGGSKNFLTLRGAVRRDPAAAAEALEILARATNGYLGMQVGAGADVVQLFDTWTGLFDRSTFERLVVPAARASLVGLDSPSIYFAPGAGHTLDLQAKIGADGYGVDWRLPIDEAWTHLGAVAVQGNLDPAALLTDPNTIKREVKDLLARTAGQSGHVVNLGHGIDRNTPPEHVAAFVEAVRS